MTENIWISPAAVMRHFGYSESHATHFARQGGVFAPCRRPGADPRFHVEQIRLIDSVLLGNLTQSEANRQWDEFRKIASERKIAALPGRRKTKHAS